MSDRDPFPMSSPEAERLESSVKSGSGGNNTLEWGAMDMRSDVQGPSSTEADSHDQQSGTGLLGESLGGKNPLSPDDIYAGIDEEGNEEDLDDDFLDIPLTELRNNSPFMRATRSTRILLGKIYTRLYGDQLPPSEMLRTLCLASTFFFMIGGYWLLRSLKDPILTALCGLKAIPRAKILSVFVMLGVVTIYNHLLDSGIPRHRFFYLFGSFYFVFFTTIGLLLMHDTIGLKNEKPSPYRILGWLTYCGIESFGSVMVSLFWSFANSNFSLATAKSSYGVMVATGQIGSIVGPTFINQFATKWGLARCFLVGASCMMMLQLTMFGYIHIYGAEERNATSKKSKPKAGILEGLELFLKHNYVKGIFAISALFMVEVTIIDFTMKALAKDYFASLHPCDPGMSCWDTESEEHGMSKDATAAFTTFMGLFGLATNTLSFFLSLLGTSAVIRYLGLRLTLLLFPSICLLVIIYVRLKPTLYVVFSAMMILKACSYSLNNPTKEMLYQPTSVSVRYKAKSWIDVFGARGSKAMGSLVTNAFSDSTTRLVANGSLVGMAVASFLIWNARFMGKKFDEYVACGYIVGEENDRELVASADNTGDEEGMEMARNQNENVDTSCALPDNEDEEVEISFGDDDDDEEEEEEEEQGEEKEAAKVVSI